MPSPLTPPSSSKKIHPLVDKMSQSIESARESIAKYRSTGNLEILLPYFEMILINKEILPIVGFTKEDTDTFLALPSNPHLMDPIKLSGAQVQLELSTLIREYLVDFYARYYFPQISIENAFVFLSAQIESYSKRTIPHLKSEIQRVTGNIIT